MKAEPVAIAENIEIPAEWAPQAAIWTAWPLDDAELWPDIGAARAEVGGMIAALAEAGKVRVLAMGAEAEGSARAMLNHSNVEVVPGRYGDIWLRDTAPVFVRAGGRKAAAVFRFNGWGEKYIYPHDDEVAAFVAGKSGAPARVHDFVLEGGSVDHDGEGTVLTTRECLLNPNRNPGLSQEDIEARLRDALGAKRVVWLDEGLANDHTDGHIDNIARFAGPGHVLCQSHSGADDPNAEVLDAIAKRLDAEGFRVTRIPSPGLVTDGEGAPVAASHMNFVIFNGFVVLPTYNEEYGQAAAKALQEVFPAYRVVALPARTILTGGGSFHCITQQEF